MKLVDKSYDGNPQNLKMFLDRLADCIVVSGWEIITWIQVKDLVTLYSIVSTDEWRDEAKGYLQLESSGEFKFNIKAQLSVQMLSCIRASISDECALKVATSGENHKIEVT